MQPKINQKETKLFKQLYLDYTFFEKKIIEPLLKMHSVLPDYLDESKTFYSMETLYIFLSNKYGDFYAVNGEERTHKLMQNAFSHLLPILYIKTKQLSPEIMGMFKDPTKLLQTIEKKYNEDPEHKYASTETAYSSTPDASQGSGTFNVTNVKEKNVINRKDATIKLKEITNLMDKIIKYDNVNISGYVIDFINSIEISSLWESDLSYVNVLVGDGKFATGEFAYNVDIDSNSPDSLLTQKEVDKKLHNLGSNFNEYIDKNLLFQNNSKNIKELGTFNIHTNLISPKHIPSRQEVQDLGKSVFGEIKGSNSNIDMTQLEERTDDYLNNKADFVRVDDLIQTIKRQFLNETWVENGTNLELDLSNIDISKFKTPHLISIKSQGANQSIYIEDSYNDGNSTDQTINVNNKNESIQVEITNSKAIIKSMRDTQRQWWITNMKPIYIEQVGAGSSTIDQVARNEIADEVKKRQLEDTKLSNKINTNKTDILSNKTNKIDKQLVQNKDFSTWVDLLNLIEDDDFVNISLATGDSIWGHIIDKGAKSITLSGGRGVGVHLYYGKVMLNDQWQTYWGSGEASHYFKQNSQYLTVNNTTITGDAHIGKGYKGLQEYGSEAIGNIFVGLAAVGNQAYGFKAQGSQFYGSQAQGNQGYGTDAIGNQSYGFGAKGMQTYGYGAKGAQGYGMNATGLVEIAFSENGEANKIIFKQNANKEMSLFIDGNEKVRFRDLHPFSQNSQLLTENDQTSTSKASIGKLYKGNQYYGDAAKGNQYYGHVASGTQLYGYGAKGRQYYGDSAKGPQYYGYNATGHLSIHMPERGIKNKIEFKQNDADEMAIYIDGYERVTFRDLIDKVFPLKNSFTGSFSSSSKEREFMAITTSVRDDQFKNESNLTSISLPHVTSTGSGSFNSSRLKSIYLPNATEIGLWAFQNSKLTSLELPKVTIIYAWAFSNSNITSLDLPKVTRIDESAFENSKLTSLDLPNVTDIGLFTFKNSPLTYLNIPKVTDISYDGTILNRNNLAFASIINSPSTKVIMKSKFNTKHEKDRIFGSGNWDQITFKWV